MGYNRATKGTSLVGSLHLDGSHNTVGPGPILFNIQHGTVSVNPASLAATTKAGTAVTLAGIAVGDMVVMEPPATLEDDLLFCGAAVTNDDEVTIYLYNPTGAPIDGAALTWRYTWLDLT